MASKKQIAANRRNALKSSGSNSAGGKAHSNVNAPRHGAAAESVVVPAIEDRRDREAHRAGTLESLAPVGHLETVLAERIAAPLPSGNPRGARPRARFDVIPGVFAPATPARRSRAPLGLPLFATVMRRKVT